MGGYLVAELVEMGLLERVRTRRLAGRDMAIPCAPALEAAMIPSISAIETGIRELLR